MMLWIYCRRLSTLLNEHFMYSCKINSISLYHYDLLYFQFPAINFKKRILFICLFLRIFYSSTFFPSKISSFYFSQHIKMPRKLFKGTWQRVFCELIWSNEKWKKTRGTNGENSFLENKSNNACEIESEMVLH